MKNYNHLHLQSKIIEIANVPISVASAMECWVEWMRHGHGVKGYPQASVGFSSGGINCFDDMDSAASNYAARAVDGAIDSLDPISRNVIGSIWLGHSLHYKVNLEESASEAIKVIWRGLQIRGCA